MVLFGGSILCGGDVLARAIENRIAKCFIIVGGAGHATPTLRAKMNAAYPKIKTENLSETEIFNSYLKYRPNMDIINFATYHAVVQGKKSSLNYNTDVSKVS